jgi:probable F420-dependent oxidoreductase
VKIGTAVESRRPWTTPETIAGMAELAERLGYDSLWVPDHVVLPAAMESVYPYNNPNLFTPEHSQNYYESITTLAYLAGRTQRVQLGVSVLVVPQRQPLLAAKQWATLDALSGGRSILGVGTGWLREEFDALQADTFERRGKALDEAIEVFRKYWRESGGVAYEGEIYRFRPIYAGPKPAHPSGPPIWIGGHGRPAIRRAAQHGDGWSPVRIQLDELKALLGQLDEQCQRFGRPRSEITLACSVQPWAPGTRPPGEPGDADLFGSAEQMADRLRPYLELGVEHVIFQPQPRDSYTAVREAIELFATEARPLLQ